MQTNLKLSIEDKDTINLIISTIQPTNENNFNNRLLTANIALRTALLNTLTLINQPIPKPTKYKTFVKVKGIRFKLIVTKYGNFIGNIEFKKTKEQPTANTLLNDVFEKINRNNNIRQS